jgi:hypothetical protein
MLDIEVDHLDVLHHRSAFALGCRSSLEREATDNQSCCYSWSILGVEVTRRGLSSIMQRSVTDAATDIIMQAFIPPNTATQIATNSVIFPTFTRR